MRKQYFGILAVVLLMSLLSGCETAKGFSSGLSKDVQTGTHFLMGLDDWMRENLW
jgi:predicted small secreted protein